MGVMQRFCLTHGEEGTEVRLEEIPAWAHLLEEAGEWAAEHLLPGHRLCCDVPEWAFKIEWGKLYPDLGVREHSLGQLAWRFGTWVEMGFGAWRRAKRKGSVQVSYEWVREHFPEMGSPFTDGFNDDDVMESRAEDAGDVVL